MNADQHSMNPGGPQPPGNSSESQRSQNQLQLAPTTLPTDLRVNSASMSMSSVAKYWVFTNLLSGPIPQVSLYGLAAGPGRIENGKPVQDTILQQPGAILNGDQTLLLQQHAQAALAQAGIGHHHSAADVAAALAGHVQQSSETSQLQQQQQLQQQHQQQQQQVPNHLGLNILAVPNQHGHQNHIVTQQQIMNSSSGRSQEHTLNQNQQIQLTVSEDGLVTVVDQSTQKVLGTATTAGLTKDESMGGAGGQEMQAITIQQLQQLVGHQVIDGMVRIDPSSAEGGNILVTQNPDGTTSIQSSGGTQGSPVKDDKGPKMLGHFTIPDIKGEAKLDLKNLQAGQMMDVRTADGSIVKIAASISGDHDQNMYKVNVEDLSQLLAYHEVFGKINAENVTPKVLSESEADAGASNMSEADSSPPSVGSAPGAHPCDQCGKMFQFRYQLIVHKRYHTERKPFTCQVCSQAFTNSGDLERHGKCHLEGSMFTCTVCFHVFTNSTSLERHAKRHVQDNKPYTCTTCQKSFARKEHLHTHFRSHTGETPYQCQFCSKTFTRKEHMVNHVRKHTGETPHRCDICKKSFTRKEHFMNHVMWHTAVPLFAVDIMETEIEQNLQSEKKSIREK